MIRRSSTGLTMMKRALLAAAVSLASWQPLAAGGKADVGKPSRPNSYFYGSLVSFYAGLGKGSPLYDFDLQVGSLGFGLGRGRLAVLASTSVYELAPSGHTEGSSRWVAEGWLPLYVSFVHGIQRGPIASRPALYGLVGGDAWLVGGNMPYLHAAIGAKWRIAVLSPAVQVTWRRVWDRASGWAADMVTAGVKLELGGWYPARTSRRFGKPR